MHSSVSISSWNVQLATVLIGSALVFVNDFSLFVLFIIFPLAFFFLFARNSNKNAFGARNSPPQSFDEIQTEKKWASARFLNGEEIQAHIFFSLATNGNWLE